MHDADLHHLTEITNSQSTSRHTSCTGSLHSKDMDHPDILDIPPRSPSRLGIHDSPELVHDTTQKQTSQRPPLQRRASGFERDRHSYSYYDVDLEDLSFSNSDSSEQDDDSASDTSESSSEDDFIFDAFFAPKPIHAPVSPIIHTTTLSEPTSPVSTPASSYRHSPLSPHKCDPPPIVFRHNYAHHGFSRSALMHQKWFWHCRYEEWAEWEAQAEEAASAYDGIAVPPKPPPRGSHINSVVAPHSSSPMSEKPLADPSAPIYPRTGDLSALRNPESVHLDRWFCYYPLYQVRKKLFLHDMEQRSKWDQDEDLEDLFGYEDSDADTTLVADMFDLSVIDLEEDQSVVQCRRTCKRNVRPWETNWVVRWEKFAELLRDEAMSRVQSIEQVVNIDEIASEDPSLVERPKTPKFYFEEADEEEIEDESESDEDDYGVVMSNPRFGRSLGFGLVGFGHDIVTRSNFDARREVDLVCA